MTQEAERSNFTAAEIGAIAHLYRGEVYRSTIWRTRLDTTTNWAVVTLGIALSISFASPDASPVPLVLVGTLIIFFLILEARRYRYFNVWRARCRWIELHFYVPMLVEGDLHLEENWQNVLAKDYREPQYHVTFMTSVGRRIRHNYLWILLIQTIAFFGKIMVHPVPISSPDQIWERASVGPVSGQVIIAVGALYILTWGGLAFWSYRTDGARARKRGNSGSSMG